MERRLETFQVFPDESENDLEVEEQVEKKDRLRSLLEPYRGICGMLPRKRMLALAPVILSLATVSPEVKEKIMDAWQKDETTEKLQMPDTSNPDWQLETSNVKELEAVFSRAAEIIRANDYEGKPITPEQVETFAQEVENFPVKEIIQQLSIESELPPDYIARQNLSSHIDLNMYSDGEVSEIIDELQQQTRVSERDKKMIRRSYRSAGANINRSLIIIRVEDIVADGITEDQLRWRIRDTLIHEFFHGFPHHKFSRNNGHPEEMFDLFYEGETELRANRMRQIVYTDSPVNDPIAGYATGGNEIAALVAGVIQDETALGAAYVEGDFSKYEELFEAKAGFSLTDAFKDQVTFDDWEAHEKYLLATRLNGILNRLPEDLRVDAVDYANSQLETGLIVPVETPDGQGVVFESSLSPNGFANGVFYPKDGKPMVLPYAKSVKSAPNKEYREVVLDGYRPNTEYRLEDLDQEEREEIAKDYIQKCLG